MNCSYCGALNPTMALYCAECGEAFIRAKQWRDRFAYFDDQTNRQLTVHLSIRNDAEGPVRPIEIQSVNGAITLPFDDVGPVQKGEEERMINLDKSQIEVLSTAQTHFVCKMERPHLQEDELVRTFTIPAPPLHVLPYPDIVLDIGGEYAAHSNDEVRRLGAPMDTPPLDTPIPISFRVSTDYKVSITCIVNNQSSAFIRKARIETPMGEVVDAYTVDDPTPPQSGSETTRDTVSLRFPERAVGPSDEAARYFLIVDVYGVPRPFEIPFKPLFRVRPTFQFLVERPTRAGRAFVGPVTQANNDVSRARLQGESVAGLTLHESRREALLADDLVTKTLKSLEEDVPRIQWSVPRGKSRSKQISIDPITNSEVLIEEGNRLLNLDARLQSMNVDGARAERSDWGFLYSAEVTIGADTQSFGPFRSDDRKFVSIQIPALEQTMDGHLTLRNSKNGESFLQADLRFNVFEQKPVAYSPAVDFGTTNSCVALTDYEAFGRREAPRRSLANTMLVPIGRMHGDWESAPQADNTIQQSAIIPTRLFPCTNGEHAFSPESETSVYGYVFEEFKVELRQSTVSAAKTNSPPSPHPEESPVRLARIFIEGVLSRTQMFLEERGVETSELSRLMCTVPTVFTDAERATITEIYKDAQSAIGVTSDRISLMDESMAAFNFERLASTTNTLSEFSETGVVLIVYDFGGGTTDTTALEGTLRSDGGVASWSFSEIAAGGDSSLGGRKATDWLIDKIFPGGETRQKRDVERLKVLLREHMDDDQAIGTAFAKSLNVRTNSEAATKVAGLLKSEYYETHLGPKCERILLDVLSKAARRMDPRDVPDEGRPVLILLAGQSTNLVGFEDLIRDRAVRAINQACAAHEEGDFLPFSGLASVRQVSEPKPCVAKGAYLSAGRTRAPKEFPGSHISYWAELGMDVEQTSVPTYTCGDGINYAQLIPEGNRPASSSVPVSVLGLGAGGEVQIHQRLGIVFQPMKKIDIPEAFQDPVIRIQVSEAGDVSAEIIESANVAGTDS